jgi:hypothetical protein
LQTARSRGVILFGGSPGVAEVVATSAGRVRLFVGYHTSQSCGGLWACARCHADTCDVAAADSVCFVQTDIAGSWQLSSTSISSYLDVGINGWLLGSLRIIDWGPGSGHPAHAGLSAVRFRNFATRQYTFSGFLYDRLLESSGTTGNAYNFGFLSSDFHSNADPAVCTAQGGCADFTSGRYVWAGRPHVNNERNDDEGISAGAIALSVFVPALCAVIVAAGIAFICKRSVKARADAPSLGTDNRPAPAIVLAQEAAYGAPTGYPAQAPVYAEAPNADELEDIRHYPGQYPPSYAQDYGLGYQLITLDEQLQLYQPYPSGDPM